MASNPITQLMQDWRAGADGAECERGTPVFKNQNASGPKTAGISMFVGKIRPKSEPKQIKS